MNDRDMTPEEEHEFYGRPENQLPQGPARRRRQRMTDPVPVRFPPEMLERVKAAASDDRGPLEARRFGDPFEPCPALSGGGGSG